MSIVEFDTINELIAEGAIKRHHSAWSNGYVSRKNKTGEIYLYDGKFGKGLVVHEPSWRSTRYHKVIYYIVSE